MSRRHKVVETISVHVPFVIRKYGGRKQVVAPIGFPAHAQRQQVDSTLVKALGRAFRWKRMLESGEFATVKELAEHEKMAFSYLTRVLRLCLLVTELSNYMLYNFHDDPKDLFERMRLNVALNEELNVRIFSFPMRYQPVNRPDRGHIGKKWNSYYLRSLQVVLQATHGVVSGAPDFFRNAYGDTFEEFENILFRPHHFIFNRYWYEQFEGKAEFEAFQSTISTLSPDERTELMGYLCGRNKNDYLNDLVDLAPGHLRDAARFFVPIPKADEEKIWEAQKRRRVENIGAYLVPDDERVEDAALTDQDIQPSANATRNVKQVFA